MPADQRLINLTLKDDKVGVLRREANAAFLECEKALVQKKQAEKELKSVQKEKDRVAKRYVHRKIEASINNFL